MTETFRKYKLNIANILTRYGIPDNFFSRGIGIYLFLSGIYIIKARKNDMNVLDDWKIFIEEYPLKGTLFQFIIYFGFVSAFFEVFRKHQSTIAEILDSVLLIFGTLFLSCSLMWKNDNFYLCIGVCLTSIAFIVYGTARLNPKYLENISSKIIFAIIILFSVIIIRFICMTTIAKHEAFGTTCFDMGIFVQMFHSLAHNLTAVTTCERDMFLSHFHVHASYIFYLLVPFYALFPHEDTLFTAQAILTVSGIIPMFLIAKQRNFKGFTLLFACILYLFSNGLLAPCYYHFHENCFLPTLLLWLLYAVERRNYPLLYIMSVLVCIVKEDAPLYVMCIALYFIFEEHSRKSLHGVLIFGLSTGYFVFITNWLTEHGDGSMMMSTRFGNLTIDQKDGFIGIIHNVLSNPSYFVSLFVQESTVLFLIEMLLPMLFVPFMTKKIYRYFLMIPFIIMNLVIGSGYGYAAEMGYQYTFGTAALLIYLTLINTDDFVSERRTVSMIVVGAVSIITAFSLISGKISYYENYHEREEHFKAIESCLDTIPDGYSVISDTVYLPHIADREEIYLFGDEDFEKNGDEIIGLKDMERYDFYVLNRWNDAVPYLEIAGYTIFAECENTVVIYVNPDFEK